MTSAELEAVAAEAWAEGLGCDLRLLSEPGPHLVPGGTGLQSLNGVYLARVGAAVLAYCPAWLPETRA